MSAIMYHHMMPYAYIEDNAHALLLLGSGLQQEIHVSGIVSYMCMCLNYVCICHLPCQNVA